MKTGVSESTRNYPQGNEISSPTCSWLRPNPWPPGRPPTCSRRPRAQFMCRPCPDHGAEQVRPAGASAINASSGSSAVRQGNSLMMSFQAAVLSSLPHLEAAARRFPWPSPSPRWHWANCCPSNLALSNHCLNSIGARAGKALIRAKDRPLEGRNTLSPLGFASIITYTEDINRFDFWDPNQTPNDRFLGDLDPFFGSGSGEQKDLCLISKIILHKRIWNFESDWDQILDRILLWIGCDLYTLSHWTTCHCCPFENLLPQEC